jgi:phosphate starvation-inducible PhoH-like protein
LDTDRTLEFEDPQTAGYLYGRGDANLKALERELKVSIRARGTTVSMEGPEPALVDASRVLVQLYELVREGFQVNPQEINRAVKILRQKPEMHLRQIFLDKVLSSSQRAIAPKNLNQKLYIDSIRENDVVFGVGPAGTGKTYLAMAMALGALTRKEVKRIILTRPAVEAGEKLGFLPGDLQEKVSPYLRPLYDALHDMMDFDKVQGLISRNVIEIAPLAFMRGRTLNNAFVILDEAQNTTRSQMKMLLTRIGFDSKAVITGDVTQTDLPDSERSGLVEAMRILRGVRGISICEFTREDVVRHPLVMKIIAAYERDDARREMARMARLEAMEEGGAVGPRPTPRSPEAQSSEDSSSSSS